MRSVAPTSMFSLSGKPSPAPQAKPEVAAAPVVLSNADAFERLIKEFPLLGDELKKRSMISLQSVASFIIRRTGVKVPPDTLLSQLRQAAGTLNPYQADGSLLPALRHLQTALTGTIGGKNHLFVPVSAVPERTEPSEALPQFFVQPPVEATVVVMKPSDGSEGQAPVVVDPQGASDPENISEPIALIEIEKPVILEAASASLPLGEQTSPAEIAPSPLLDTKLIEAVEAVPLLDVKVWPATDQQNLEMPLPVDAKEEVKKSVEKKPQRKARTQVPARMRAPVAALTVPTPRMPVKREGNLAPKEPLSEFERQLLGVIPDLRAFARFLAGNPTEADDLVSSTLERAIKAQNSFDLKTNIKAWTFTILRNIRINSYRSKRIEVDISDFSESLSTYANQEHSLELADVFAAMGGLVPEHAQTLNLIRVQGCSYEEAASIQKVKLGTIKSRLNRADAALRAALNEMFGRSQPPPQDVHPHPDVPKPVDQRLVSQETLRRLKNIFPAFDTAMKPHWRIITAGGLVDFIKAQTQTSLTTELLVTQLTNVALTGHPYRADGGLLPTFYYLQAALLGRVSGRNELFNLPAPTRRTKRGVPEAPSGLVTNDPPAQPLLLGAMDIH